ncbi:hypothetical protein [Brevundimonas sp.]|uniref:hypothetical protein n=1 Tax=Brevundimonas sp. TaxID=1871086 RepID=UPI002FDAEA36
MNDTPKDNGFLHGFLSATAALGVLLLCVWIGLWAVQALGGPDWRMPMKLLYSAFTLIFLGLALRTVMTARKN